MSTEDIILKAENISKQYRLGTVGTGTLSHDLNRWWHRIRGKEDPYLKVGETNDRSKKGNSEYVWALQDINFEVKRGEVLGIIGKNGAGKSTLLKILSKVTAPTTGIIKSKGRIASLLEVGTGFNPELTGRENIYLNGAILGMTKKEITSKLAEIIEFSGCERYIDTPTKRYSSGMTVRLAFAVAAFLEPEILVVDEVLAVGDAEFQKKAIGKMQDISREGGRTVLFVSHNMAAVKSLCTRGIMMENGKIVGHDDIDTIIEQYMSSNSKLFDSGLIELEDKKSRAFIKKIMLYEIGANGVASISNKIKMGFGVRLDYEVVAKVPINLFKSSVLIKNSYDTIITSMRTHEMTDDLIKFDNKLLIKLMIDDVKLMPGDYFVTIAIADSNGNIEVLENCHHFTVFENDVYNTGRIPKGNNIVYSNAKWEFEKESIDC